MNRRKLNLFFLAALFVCTSLIGGTQAYLSDYDVAQNALFAGGNETEITEEFPSVTPIPVKNDPVISKRIFVTNSASGSNGRNVDCYVRVRLSYSDMDIGKAISIQGLDTQNWIPQDDGYYYYKPVLKKGSKTTALCSGFAINSRNVEDTYKDRLNQFYINVYEESVQAGNFSNWETAWNYYDSSIGKT